MDENVVIDGVADRATNYTDGESQRGDRSNEIVWTDDGGDDRSGYNNAPYAEASKNQEAPGTVEVVCIEAGEGGNA